MSAKNHQLAMSVTCLLMSAAWMPAQAALKLRIVEGNGAVNNIQQRVAREPIVEVRDEDNRPVSGAIVMFMLPENGAGGTFADGSRLLTVATGPDGRAAAFGFQPNAVPGKFEIEVLAKYDDWRATKFIRMKNAVPGAISGAKLALILAVAGGAVATGVVLATRGPSSPEASILPGDPIVQAPPPILITPGPGAVGAPF